MLQPSESETVVLRGVFWIDPSKNIYYPFNVVRNMEELKRCLLTGSPVIKGYFQRQKMGRFG